MHLVTCSLLQHPGLSHIRTRNYYARMIIQRRADSPPFFFSPLKKQIISIFLKIPKQQRLINENISKASCCHFPKAFGIRNPSSVQGCSGYLQERFRTSRNDRSWPRLFINKCGFAYELLSKRISLKFSMHYAENYPLLRLIELLREVISMLLFLTGLFAGSVLMFIIKSLLMVSKKSDRI